MVPNKATVLRGGTRTSEQASIYDPTLPKTPVPGMLTGDEQEATTAWNALISRERVSSRKDMQIYLNQAYVVIVTNQLPG